MISVIVPTRGEAPRLAALFAALERQSLPRERWELVLALDGVPLPADLTARLGALGGRVARLERRGGPGAARNAGAEAAGGDWLAFTEDDVTPASDWLERMAARIDADAALEVVEGLTVKPGGKPVHRQSQDHPLYLPTNLFVRRDVFARVGGYCEDYFDAATGIYFREDADFGFALEAAGAVVGRESAAVVTHPEEHADFLDPLRWTRRHLMDALLEARHPERFRERLEVHRLGPVAIRRPILRACETAALFSVLALVNRVFGLPSVASWLACVAALGFVVVWAKWRCDPRRLPMALVVPFVMVWTQGQGHRRAKRLVPAKH